LRTVTIEGTHTICLGDEVGSLEAGKVLVRDDEAPTADEVAIRAEAQEQAKALARRVAADPAHKGMALLGAMEARQL
jgi:hypothetical protein